MTHIASCMRPADPSSPVYITMETSFLDPVSPATTNPTLFHMAFTAPRRSKSLRNLKADPEESVDSVFSLDKTPSASTSKYQFWPSASSKSPVTQSRAIFSSDRLSALSMGRSPTSLSDTVVTQETVPFWQRSSSLARRRKVSVPELGTTMTTVQEMPIDSRKLPPPSAFHAFHIVDTRVATIPGRPPLRKASTEAFGHERSSSAPGTNWRNGPFGDALMSCVTGPSPAQADTSTTPPISEQANASFGKPLSPILSPGVSARPTLKVDTDVVQEDGESPPKVPPKSPAAERKGSPSPLKLNTKSSRSQLTTPASATPAAMSSLNAFDSRRSPNVNAPLPTPLSASSNPFSVASPSIALDHRASPKIERRDPMASASTHNRNLSESSVMDRGRPVRRSSKRSRSRTASETNNSDEPAPDNWQLPKGMRVADASRRMGKAEKATLYKQASAQADKFEVMNKRDVASMSRVCIPSYATCRAYR